jgi:hypothetical protein
MHGGRSETLKWRMKSTVVLVAGKTGQHQEIVGGSCRQQWLFLLLSSSKHSIKTKEHDDKP